MPPLLAALLTVGFIAFLFRRDLREQPNVTAALWIPIAWFVINSSRYVSQWLELAGISLGGVTVEDGSPVDACFYLCLILSGIYVLRSREVRLAHLFQKNFWLLLFLVYCFISIVWSDFPFISLKRWIKTLGHPIMALIILTEPDPREAIARFVKRSTYILVPISILFIKYYPEWGRTFDSWSGGALETGIGVNKNQLGIICLISGYFFIWHLLQLRRLSPSRARRDEILLALLFLVMIGWLIKMAHSSTAMVALFAGMGVILALGFPFERRSIGTYFILAVVFSLLAESGFGVTDLVIRMLGKDPTLTDRTILWDYLLKIHSDIILGTGFESFWLGARRLMLENEFKWGPNQAHNGYLETYLNLGSVGLVLLAAVLLDTFRKCRAEFLRDFEFGRYRLGFLVAVMLYNWTEASFKAMHPVWTVFYIIALDYQGLHEVVTASDGEIELAADKT